MEYGKRIRYFRDHLMAVLMVVILDQMEDMLAMEQILSDHISRTNRQGGLVVHRG